MTTCCTALFGLCGWSWRPARGRCGRRPRELFIHSRHRGSEFRQQESMSRVKACLTDREAVMCQTGGGHHQGPWHG